MVSDRRRRGRPETHWKVGGKKEVEGKREECDKGQDGEGKKGKEGKKGWKTIK